jgi:hypothetical protein
MKLEEVHPQLIQPFPLEVVELKPGALSKDKAKALALPYADMRVYQERLDEVVGAGWQVEYRPLTEETVFCRLTILGVAREDVGECRKIDKNGVPDENRSCSAIAQAFKRACTAFGIGRYLYSLPQVWGEFDPNKRQFREPARLIAEIYKKAGLSTGNPPRRGPSPASSASSATSSPASRSTAPAASSSTPRSSSPAPSGEEATPSRPSRPQSPEHQAKARQEQLDELDQAFLSAQDGAALRTTWDRMTEVVPSDDPARPHFTKRYQQRAKELGLAAKQATARQPTPNNDNF